MVHLLTLSSTGTFLDNTIVKVYSTAVLSIKKVETGLRRFAQLFFTKRCI